MRKSAAKTPEYGTRLNALLLIGSIRWLGFTLRLLLLIQDENLHLVERYLHVHESHCFVRHGACAKAAEPCGDTLV